MPVVFTVNGSVSLLHSMLVRLALCCLSWLISKATNAEQQVPGPIPFCESVEESNRRHSSSLVVMQPQTIINQTLHSYCKEQLEFSSEPMFIDLTE